MPVERYSEILRRLTRRALTDAATARGSSLPPLAQLTKDQMLVLAGSLGVDMQAVHVAAKADLAAQIAAAGSAANAAPIKGNVIYSNVSAADLAEWHASAEGRHGDQGEPAAPAAPTDDNAALAVSADPVEAAAERDFQELAGLWAAMDPLAFKARLREMTVLANRPPVEIVREVVIHAPAGAATGTGVAPRSAPVSRRVGQTTAAEAFGIAGRLGTTVLPLYDGTQSPPADPDYVWMESTGALLSRLFGRHRPIWLAGPKGTGKTSWAEQLAARLGRPYARLTCTATTEAATLLGMTVPSAGGVAWQDGSLTAALRRPGCVILIDEPTVARSGSLYAFQSLLDNARSVTIEETGEVVPIHPDSVFIFCDNTNGSGDTTGAYVGTGPISAALVDRMGALEIVDYLPADAERNVLRAKTKAPAALARLLVDFARVTRAKTTSGDLAAGLGLRALLSWAEQIMDGVPVETAARLAFINAAPADTVVQLTQLLATHAPADKIEIAAGIAPPPPPPQPIVHNDSDESDQGERFGFAPVTDTI